MVSKQYILRILHCICFLSPPNLMVSNFYWFLVYTSSVLFCTLKEMWTYIFIFLLYLLKTLYSIFIVLHHILHLIVYTGDCCISVLGIALSFIFLQFHIFNSCVMFTQHPVHRTLVTYFYSYRVFHGMNVRYFSTSPLLPDPGSFQNVSYCKQCHAD